jgi:type IV pilus assembly protein PilC
MNKFNFFKKSAKREKKDLPKKDKSKNKKDQPKQEVLDKQKIKEAKDKIKIGFFDRLSAHEKELFAKRLSYLLKAGIPILQSLEMIKDQTRLKLQKKIIQSLMESVANGQSLYASLTRFKNIFGDFMINVIRIGEDTGTLDQNLSYLAEELKNRRLLGRKVVGAFVYPAFIALVTIAITALLIIFIFPKILPIFKSLNVPLPFTTRFLIAFSNFLTTHGLEVLIGLVIFIIISIFVSRLKAVRIFMGNVTPSIPIIGIILQNYQLATTARTLGILLKSNVTLVESLKITGETTQNLVYKRILEKMGENILKGRKLSSQFYYFPRFFPILIPQMLSIGETTGNLSGSFIYLAEFYESELDEMTKNLSNVLEPILMIIMGVIVGTVVISIITPIYGITQHLNVR